MNENYIFYILMRNDLDSLNPGKACAQAAHAANMLSEYYHRSDMSSYKEEIECYNSWLGGPRGFGTTIVLGCNINELNEVLIRADLNEVINGRVFDETYPIKDGQVTHYIPLITCGFLFGAPSKIKSLIKNLNLMA